MNYRVIYSPTFRGCIAAQVDYLREQHVPDDIIENWFNRLFDRLDDLNEWPRRYPVDARMTAQIGIETRKLVFGRYVITYHVDDHDHSVQLLAMVHGARRK